MLFLRSGILYFCSTFFFLGRTAVYSIQTSKKRELPHSSQIRGRDKKSGTWCKKCLILKPSRTTKSWLAIFFFCSYYDVRWQLHDYIHDSVWIFKNISFQNWVAGRRGFGAKVLLLNLTPFFDTTAAAAAQVEIGD